MPAARVVQVGPPPGHAGAEVCADRTQHDHHPTGHVLAAVGADALHHGLRPGVADREAHPRPTHEVEPTARGAIQAGVAGDRLPGGLDREIRLRSHRDPTPGQPLADVVIGLTDQGEVHARPGECPERLSGRATQFQPNGAVQLAALQRPGDPRPERSIRGGQPQARGGHRALIAERGRDPRLQWRRRCVPCRAGRG